MNPTAVTDFVTEACSKACHHAKAIAGLHQAGHSLGADGGRGGLLIVALLIVAVSLASFAMKHRSAAE